MQVNITETETEFKMEAFNDKGEKVFEQEGKEFTVNSPFGNDYMEFEKEE